MVALMKMPSRLEADPWAERRMFPRKEFHAEITGHRLDHTVQARQDPRLSLTLRDLSLGGLSAISDRPSNGGGSMPMLRATSRGRRAACDAPHAGGLWLVSHAFPCC